MPPRQHAWRPWAQGRAINGVAAHSPGDLEILDTDERNGLRLRRQQVRHRDLHARNTQIAWIGIIGGYRRASPAMLAPFEYTALIGGAVAGYMIWDEIPDRWVVTGATVIIASGLFVVYREIGGILSKKWFSPRPRQ